MNLIINDLGKSFKPDKIIFVNDLPKTRNMKIMRRIIKSCLTNVFIEKKRFTKKIRR